MPDYHHIEPAADSPEVTQLKRTLADVIRDRDTTEKDSKQQLHEAREGARKREAELLKKLEAGGISAKDVVSVNVNAHDVAASVSARLRNNYSDALVGPHEILTAVHAALRKLGVGPNGLDLPVTVKELRLAVMKSRKATDELREREKTEAAKYLEEVKAHEETKRMLVETDKALQESAFNSLEPGGALEEILLGVAEPGADNVLIEATTRGMPRFGLDDLSPPTEIAGHLPVATKYIPAQEEETKMTDPDYPETTKTSAAPATKPPAPSMGVDLGEVFAQGAKLATGATVLSIVSRQVSKLAEEGGIPKFAIDHPIFQAIVKLAAPTVLRVIAQRVPHVKNIRSVDSILRIAQVSAVASVAQDTIEALFDRVAPMFNQISKHAEHIEQLAGSDEEG